MAAERNSIPKAEILDIRELKPHPRNYKIHTDEQLQQIAISIVKNDIYKNMVSSRDGYILAGHGVRLALIKKLERYEAPVVVLPVNHDHPHALVVLAGDNEIGKMALQDDRTLTELLKLIKDTPESEGGGLDGTGFDLNRLNALLFVSRPASEVAANINYSDHWEGMPEYDNGSMPVRLSINFRSNQDRLDFCKQKGIAIKDDSLSSVIATWWPERELNNPSAIKFIEKQ